MSLGFIESSTVFNDICRMNIIRVKDGEYLLKLFYHRFDRYVQTVLKKGLY